MNVDTNTNYLTNSLSAAKQFAKEAVARLQSAVERKPWGSYQSSLGSAVNQVGEQVRNVKQAVAVKQSQGVYPGGKYSDINTQKTYSAPNAVGVAASIPADILTNATRRQVWRYTNMHRLIGDVGQYVGPRLGLDSPLSGAVVAAGVPIALGTLSGQIGPLKQGLRPLGQKAVAPVSKEEDPTGRTSRSALLEATMRYGLGQRGQLLPYQEFKKERPDVAPSTYAQYRRYENMRPAPGKNVVVDPEGQSFSVLGGVVRGTARGLNDPEIRLKGVPITLSAALGTAAGLGTIKGLSRAMESPPIGEFSEKGLSQLGSDVPVKEKLQALISSLPAPTIGEKIGAKLGSYRDPALLAAGAVAAVGTAAVTRKLLQKSAERRIKKENPVEYLKHKHGSLEQASSALGQPNANSWQQLVPYIK